MQASVAERLHETRTPVRGAVGTHRIDGHLRLLQSTVSTVSTMSKVSTVLACFRVPLCGHIDVNTGLTVRKPKLRRYERANPKDLVPIAAKKLGRIPDGGGWRPSAPAAGQKNKREEHSGWPRVSALNDR